MLFHLKTGRRGFWQRQNKYTRGGHAWLHSPIKWVTLIKWLFVKALKMLKLWYVEWCICIYLACLMENIHDHISFCNCCITHISDEIMSRYTYLRDNDELIVGHHFISLSLELDIFINDAILDQKKTQVKRNQNKICPFTQIDPICCLLQWVAPIYPMKYALGSWFFVFCCAWVQLNLSISARVTSLVPQPSHDYDASNAN